MKKISNRTMDFILVLIGLAVLVFSIVMIKLYLLTGAIPDTLCTCFFVACTGECGFMGWIKSAKVRYEDREWQLKYEQLQRELAKEQEKEINVDDILRDSEITI